VTGPRRRPEFDQGLDALDPDTEPLFDSAMEGTVGTTAEETRQRLLRECLLGRLLIPRADARTADRMGTER